MEHIEAEMLKQVKLLATQMKGHFEAGVSDESSKSISDRILAIDSKSLEGRRQILVASDGLTIKNKICWEQEFLPLVTSNNQSQMPFSLYFKRQKPKETPPGSPPPVFNRQQSYGLKNKKRAIPQVKNIIAIASGKGGVGKSTVSSQTALTMQRMGYKTGILDADVYGPSAHKMLGVTGQPQVQAGKIAPLVGEAGVKVMSFGILSEGNEPVMWRGPLVSKSLEQFCYQVDWGELDYLIIDFPPGTGDVQLSLLEMLPIHGALVVTTPQDIALIDAQKALAMFAKLNVPILGLVENMAYFKCSSCGSMESVFPGDNIKMLKEKYQTEILAKVPLNPSIALACENGDQYQDERSTHHSPFMTIAEEINLKL